jgi:hypothetical protein
MEVLQIDDTEDGSVDFHDRAFVYFCGLNLQKYTWVSNSMLLLEKLLEEGLCTPEDYAAEGNLEAAKNIIPDIEAAVVPAVETIVAISKKLCADYDSKLPVTRSELLDIGIDEVVVSNMMRDVYGSSEIFASLSVRKVVVALDMVDWEDSGATTKLSVKMTDFKANKVKASLNTWLKRGERMAFLKAADSLGRALAEISRENLFWGPFRRTLNKHFNAKEKKSLEDIVNKLNQFIKATKRGGKKCEDSED